MKSITKIVAGLLALLIVLFAGAALFIHTLDADKYRPQLVELLTKKTGRAVKLNGPIALSLGLKGIKMSVQDASIANPAWASRPNLAGMGKFEVGVGLLPLLSHQISINELAIENADILLETNAAGQHNWDIGPQVALKPGEQTLTEKPTTPSEPTSNEALSIKSLTITNSQLVMRAADGKGSTYNVAGLSLGMGAMGGAELKFKGEANGAPITLNVTTGIKNLFAKAIFPFDADLTYNAIHLTAKGNADISGSKADISAYEITAGKTVITGNVGVTWGGPRPAIQGALNSARISPADFKADEGGSPTDGEVSSKQAAPSDHSDGRMFSDAPLPLAGLKAVDADLDIAVGEFPLGNGVLKQISTKLVLANGNLNLAPIRAMVGASQIEMQLRLNAAEVPAHLTVGVITNAVDLGDLQKLGGMSPFMTGKAGANIQVAGQGDSAHAIASSLGGIVVITAEKGEILTGAAAGISTTLATIFNPKGGDAALNCLAARFTVKNGVMNDNGILIDSVPSTVSAKGDINLALENVSLTLRAKTKLVDVGGLVPAVQISGGLAHPGYSVDAVGAVKNVVGGLIAGNLNLGDSGVPDLQAAPAGQNACVYTLDHPKSAPASTVLPSDAVGKASQKIQYLGNSLMNGLFGK